MKKLGMCFFIWLLAQGAMLPVSAACPETPYDGYLVKLTENAPVPLSAEWEYVLPGVYWLEDDVLAEDLVDHGIAEYAEPNYQVMLLDTEENTPAPVWAYTAMQASASADIGLTGKGVRIAVIDSGVDTENPNLEQAIIAEGYDYTQNSSEMTDSVGHGTYVTQMIAGDGDEGMMQGIAPGATIVPLRCFDGRTTDIKKLVQAIEDAANPEKYDCDIINMSWGETANSAILAEALQKAHDAGVHLVAAAGNVQAGLPQGSVLYPAALDTVIGVGAVCEDKTVSGTSQQSTAVDLCAPGHGIPACSIYGVQTSISGTSFSSPCVASVLALLLEAAPDMLPAFATELLYQSAEDLGDAGRDNAYGHGFANVGALFTRKAWLAEWNAEGMLHCWLPNRQEKWLYIAVYTPEGKLHDLWSVEGTGDATMQVFPLYSPEHMGSIRAFAVTDAWLPQISWSWNITEQSL